MKDKSNLSETIFRSSLIKTQYAEDYALTLQEIYSDIASVPHFNDEEVLLENWGIEFFYKDTQEQIEWTVIVALMTFINQTGCEVSYVLTNQKFKKSIFLADFDVGSIVRCQKFRRKNCCFFWKKNI